MERVAGLPFWDPLQSSQVRIFCLETHRNFIPVVAYNRVGTGRAQLPKDWPLGTDICQPKTRVSNISGRFPQPGRVPAKKIPLWGLASQNCPVWGHSGPGWPGGVGSSPGGVGSRPGRPEGSGSQEPMCRTTRPKWPIHRPVPTLAYNTGAGGSRVI